MQREKGRVSLVEQYLSDLILHELSRGSSDSILQDFPEIYLYHLILQNREKHSESLV